MWSPFQALDCNQECYEHQAGPWSLLDIFPLPRPTDGLFTLAGSEAPFSRHPHLD